MDPTVDPNTRTKLVPNERWSHPTHPGVPKSGPQSHGETIVAWTVDEDEQTPTTWTDRLRLVVRVPLPVLMLLLGVFLGMLVALVLT